MNLLRSRFFWRVYLGLVAVVLAVLAAVGLLLGSWIRRDTLAELHRSLREQAGVLRELAVPLLEESLPPRLPRALSGRGSMRITVIKEDGRVVAESHRDIERLDNHGSRPEILAARETGEGRNIRFSDTIQGEMLYLALPVVLEGRRLGYVRTALPLTAVEERLGQLRGLVLLGAGLGALAALLLGFALARRITRPLIAMTEAAGALARGDYGSRIHAGSNDELGRLAEALNGMAARMQARLAEAARERNKLLAILGGMVEGVVAVDREERLVHTNAAAAELLGLDPLSGLGRRIWEVTRVREVGEALAEALARNQEIRSECRLLDRKPGRTVELLASPLQTGEGGQAGAVVVLHDVTKLRQIDRMRRDFVANVSHELKTPITAIRGLAETLAEDPEMPAETRGSFLGRIQSQALRLSALVTDLLALARLESEGSPLGLAVLDLRQPVSAAFQAIQTAAGAKRLALEAELPEDQVEVRGEEGALYQLAQNLLDNAVKYTPPGGRVRVRLCRQEQEAHFTVEDTGIGIEPRHQERIFERFYRVDQSRSRELGGTGLGLAIVKHICQVHGGEVSVESTPGTGSLFRVKLPLARS